MSRRACWPSRKSPADTIERGRGRAYDRGIMSALSETANVAAICGGIVLPTLAIGGWMAKRWVNDQIVSKLSNDDTPVAKYAHDGVVVAQLGYDLVEIGRAHV